MKKTLGIILLLSVITGYGFSDKLSKIGVVDISRIVSNHFQDSAALREVERMTTDYNNFLSRKNEELLQLKEQKLLAQEQGDEFRVLKLEDEIEKLITFMQQYHNTKSRLIENKKENLLSSQTFLSEVIEAVKYVAETEGFSLIFKKQDPDILWISYDVDITDMVLEKLRRDAGRN
ncbi:MAG: OmpH family outer membrane protein [Spirochaetales bacterium]|nr:OmpH family outer membrane protein [Spirochaetales bacterium]